MGSSWVASIAVKSSSMNVIGGILGLLWRDLTWDDWMARRCFFLAELEQPPPAKPLAVEFISLFGMWSDIGPAIALITSRTLRLVWLLRSRLSLRYRVLLTGLSLCFLLVAR